VRRLVLLVVGGIVVAAGWYLMRPSPAAPPPEKAAARPSAKSAVEAPKAAPAPAPVPPPARKTAEGKAPRAEAPVEPPPAPVTASLRVETDVPATVLIDRVGVGTTPITISDLTPGPHRVNVSAPPYDGYAETLDLAPGLRTLTLQLKEIKLDATIAVVHKHGIGSCKGQLSATPAGIRYVATDGKHNFSVPLTALGTFEVDYLAKNLRVAITSGTFNFTDPDGNADRLFTFHETVAKARKRM
jgi:hypothetical protein